jgi:hypothetical protein
MEQRLLGQDVTVRLIRDGTVVSEITAIGTFDDTMENEIKEENFLGHTASTYSDVFSGYKGNLEFQSARSGWTEFVEAIRSRAQRKDPGIVFNVVRSDIYANGDSTVFVYMDVAWGPAASSIASRKEFAKHKLTFACSERSMTNNQLL